MAKQSEIDWKLAQSLRCTLPVALRDCPCHVLGAENPVAFQRRMAMLRQENCVHCGWEQNEIFRRNNAHYDWVTDKDGYKCKVLWEWNEDAYGNKVKVYI